MEAHVSTRLSQLSRSVAGVRVIVTGSASGMGRATAHVFADEGAKVVVTDYDAAGVKKVVDEIAAVYGADSVVGVHADVSTSAGRQAIVQCCLDAFGGIDALVNNAGVALRSSAFADDDEFTEAWDRSLAVNLSAHAHLMRLCVPYLKQAPHGGRIVNIASTEGILATAGLMAYTASKHGVIGVTKGFAAELGRHNITVNAVCPGPVRTAMTAGIPEDFKEIYAKRKIPRQRYGDPEEVAHMTVNLCMPASQFVNGATIVVDGGMSILHA
jgi:3-oxoacyl-[acyl-carrier protein] reductase